MGTSQQHNFIYLSYSELLLSYILCLWNKTYNTALLFETNRNIFKNKKMKSDYLLYLLQNLSFPMSFIFSCRSVSIGVISLSINNF